MVMANTSTHSEDVCHITASAQDVGREFVRQYYTLLNRAPSFLHRFFSEKSSFVHGGIEKLGEEQPPVVGQNEIHCKIMSLNFHDCHTKIRQVDSQMTIGGGVVIQVTGEISNNGERMRRFMQTFVLAPQAERNFYAHNTMFRYQDEVYTDDDEEEEEEADSEDAADMELHEEIGDGGTGGGKLPDLVTAAAAQPASNFYSPQPGQSLGNGSVGEEEEEEVEPVAMYEESLSHDVVDEIEPAMGSLDVEHLPEPGDPGQSASVAPPVHHADDAETAPAPKTVSWAEMMSRNTAQAHAASVIGGGGGPGPGQPKQPTSTTEHKPDILGGSPTDGTFGQPQSQRVFRPNRASSEYNQRGENGDGDGFQQRYSSAKYQDSHQLFVGNLLHSVTESELKEFFQGYGHVLELRINSNSSGGGKYPNFGFVLFDSEETVKEILRQKPIKFNGERLNVEQKKPRREQNQFSARGGLYQPRGGGPQQGGYGGNRGPMRSGGFGRGVVNRDGPAGGSRR